MYIVGFKMINYRDKIDEFGTIKVSEMSSIWPRMY